VETAVAACFAARQTGMTTPPGTTVGESFDLDPVYIEARRVLLDALFALAPHGKAVIVAGAQAVYLRAGAADIAVAPYTTDGDLALDPQLLGEEPEIEAAMTKANFYLQRQDGHGQPGAWLANGTVNGRPIVIPVDLIVPQADIPRTKRAARLGRHGNKAARLVPGIEAALIDHSTMTITALDPADHRSINAEVAGPAALLVAKAYKLHERIAEGKSHRLDDKDAADVVRLMQTTNPTEVGRTLAILCRDPLAGPVCAEALTYIQTLFGNRAGVGIEMAVRALEPGAPAARIIAICTAYTEQLLRAIAAASVS